MSSAFDEEDKANQHYLESCCANAILQHSIMGATMLSLTRSPEQSSINKPPQVCQGRKAGYIVIAHWTELQYGLSAGWLTETTHHNGNKVCKVRMTSTANMKVKKMC